MKVMSDFLWNHGRRAVVGGDIVPEELGKAADLDSSHLLDALQLVTQGKIYDLDSGRWPGMPLFGGHPAFQLSRYRSADGMRVQGDFDDWLGSNDVNMGFTTELMSGTMHTGTHIDALAHTTSGEDNSWYGGFNNAEHLGDFGPTRADASAIPPIITRGVLVDLTALTGGEPLPAGRVVTVQEFKKLAAQQGIEFHVGDAVLVNTGYLTIWTQQDNVVDRYRGAGIGVDVADFLIEKGAVVVGSDTETVEADPSPDPSNPHPVHIRLMKENGIHLLELAHLADMARDNVREFLFVCLPLRVAGGTGSMVRPIAIV